MKHLTSTGAFLQTAITNQDSISSDKLSQASTESEQINPIDSIDWTAYRFTSAKEIYEVINYIKMSDEKSKTSTSVMKILDRIGSSVALRDRVLHLEALNCCEPPNVSGYALTRAIAGRITDWYKSPSISSWCRGRLLDIIADKLPDFSIGVTYRESPLPDLFEKSEASSERICAMLLGCCQSAKWDTF